MEGRTSTKPDSSPEVAGVVERNIRTLLLHRREEQGNRSRQERIADAIAGFTGSLAFAYIHFVIFGLWCAINMGWLQAITPFDPSFAILAVLASVEALFLSTFVLIHPESHGQGGRQACGAGSPGQSDWPSTSHPAHQPGYRYG